MADDDNVVDGGSGDGVCDQCLVHVKTRKYV